MLLARTGKALKKNHFLLVNRNPLASVFWQVKPSYKPCCLGYSYIIALLSLACKFLLSAALRKSLLPSFLCALLPL